MTAIRDKAKLHEFEGELRTVKQIHAMIPCISETTLYNWDSKGIMPKTKTEALCRPKYIPKPNTEIKKTMSVLSRSMKKDYKL
jgi:hypothetical protein